VPEPELGRVHDAHVIPARRVSLLSYAWRGATVNRNYLAVAVAAAPGWGTR
jgi:hypothetical protein